MPDKRDRKRLHQLNGYVSTKHAMAELDVSAVRIHQLIADGELDAVYWDDRTPMITTDSVERYKTEHPQRHTRGPKPKKSTQQSED